MPVLRAYIYICKVAVADGGALRLYRQPIDSVFLQSLTGLGKRTGVAKRRSRLAQESAEIHDGLVVECGMHGVEHLVGKGAKKFLALRGIDRLVDAEVTGKDALHIAVEHGERLTEGQAHNGSSGVVANARQGPHKGVVLRELACLRYLFCCGMKMAGAAIVTQSLPEPHHLLLACIGQALCRGKPLGKAQIVAHPLSNLRLLQDELRKHDEVRVTRPAPRQVAPMSIVPML